MKITGQIREENARKITSFTRDLYKIKDPEYFKHTRQKYAVYNENEDTQTIDIDKIQSDPSLISKAFYSSDKQNEFFKFVQQYLYGGLSNPNKYEAAIEAIDLIDDMVNDFAHETNVSTGD